MYHPNGRNHYGYIDIRQKKTSNLSYTITIGTLSTKEAERIYTFKLLVSKLLRGRGGGGSGPLPGV